MSDSLTVYDLGNIDEPKKPLFVDEPDFGASGGHDAAGTATAERPAGGSAAAVDPAAAATRRRRPARGTSGPLLTERDSFRSELDYLDQRIRAPRVGWRLSGSLSLWIPGTGQIAMGETQLGILYLSVLGFAGALGWALFDSLDRLVDTFRLFDYPGAAAFWLLALVYFTGSIAYLSNVLSATAHADGHRANTASPVLCGIASGILPGWGQVLNGDRMRAILFLTSVLALVAIGVTLTPRAFELLDGFGLYLPYWKQLHAAPTLRWTVPILIWALAVYDAVQSAVGKRRAREA